MKLNCKPGDLAVIVGPVSTLSLSGRIVQCVRLLEDGELVDGFDWVVDVGGPTWLIESSGSPMLWGNDLVMRRAFADWRLRPIRDNDGEDETLQWLDVPRKVAA